MSYNILNKIKKNKEKILNSIIAISFILSSTITTPVFAEVTADSQQNLQSNKTDKDKQIENNVANNSGADSLGKKDLSSSTSSTTTTDDKNKDKDDDLKTLNKSMIEKAKATQQSNETSTQASNVYMVTNASGETITVQDNPCYLSDSEKCQNMVYQNVLNSSGVVTSSKSVPNRNLKYITSNGQDVTSNMESQITAQKAMNNTINQATSTSNTKGLVANYISSAISTLPANASWTDRLSTLAMAIMAGKQAQKQIEDEAYKNQIIENAQDDIKKVASDRAKEAQDKRNVLQQTSKRYTAKILPTIPILESSEDITITLIPNKKYQSKDDYTIKAKVRNLDTGAYDTLEVLENTPFPVELHTWKNRTAGKRTVTIIYTFANNSEPEQSTITYTVGDTATAILPDGRNVANSVTALVGNADILNYNQQTKNVAGRVTKAKWISDGDSSYCALNLTDSKTNTDKAYEVSIMTNNVPESKCNESLVNEYASFMKVRAKLNDNGEYVFADTSSSEGVSVGMSESAYDSLEDKEASNAQSNNDKKDTTALRVDSKTGMVYESLPGELGVNYIYVPSWSKCLSIYKDSDGSYSIRKADGTEYSKEEKALLPITEEALNSIKLYTDDNGKVYAMSGNKVISGQLDIDSVSNISKGNNLASLSTPNLDNNSNNNINSSLLNTTSSAETLSQSSSNSSVIGINNAMTALKKTIENTTKLNINKIANLGSLIPNVTSNSTDTTTNAILNNNSTIENNNNDENIKTASINDYCKNKSITECNMFKTQLENAFMKQQVE